MFDTNLGANSHTLHSTLLLVVQRGGQMLLWCTLISQYSNLFWPCTVLYTVTGGRNSSRAHFASLHSSLSMPAVSLVDLLLNYIVWRNLLAALYYSVLFCCYWIKVWGCFFFFILFSLWNYCYWREPEVLLMDYLMFLKCAFASFILIWSVM